MNNLYRLVYTSFRKPECTDDEINNILSACNKNNPGRDVTGVLLHSENRFIQYMEGDKEELEKLFNHIKTDDRHTAVNKRNFETISERLFPSWEMGYRDLSANEMVYQTEVSPQNKETIDQLFEGTSTIDDRGIRLLRIFSKVS